METSKQKEQCKVHEKITGEKHFQCHYCHKSFKKQAYCIVHEKIHTGKKNFQCNYCFKNFVQKINRDRHVRTHTGEKPFRCQLCDKAFTDASYLTQHMISHSDLRPFKCANCAKSFKYTNGLWTHRKSCTTKNAQSNKACAPQNQDVLEEDETKLSPMNEERNHNKCLLCPLSFKLSIELKHHFRRVHGKEVEEESANFFKDQCLPSTFNQGSSFEYSEPFTLTSGKVGEWNELTVELDGKKYRLLKCLGNPKLVKVILLNSEQ